MDNDQFLQFEIRNLAHLFTGEMIAIKNADLEYAAMSQSFADEFDLGEHVLGQCLGGKGEKSQQDILEQERKILAGIQHQDSTYFYEKNRKIKCCAVRKRQLINPFNSQVVGIFIIAIQFTPGFWRKYYIRQLAPTITRKNIEASVKLTEQQQQIVFGLLLGFHSRREIAGLLNRLMASDFDEVKIKNSLNTLYQKFECNSTSQLLTLISHDQIRQEIPAQLITLGNYPFE